MLLLARGRRTGAAAKAANGLFAVRLAFLQSHPNRAARHGCWKTGGHCRPRRLALPPYDVAPIFFVADRRAAVLVDSRDSDPRRRRLAGRECRRWAAAWHVSYAGLDQCDQRPTDFIIAILVILLLGDPGRSSVRVRERTEFACAGLAQRGTAGSCKWTRASDPGTASIRQ
jgi:hypothetical protein